MHAAPALNHVALTVADRERSARFYGEHYGFVQRVHEDEHLLLLSSAEGGYLALFEGDPPPLPRTNHFGFQSTDVAAVRRARAELRAAGVTETEWQDDPGMVRVQVADPDGYRVDLFAFT
jgi:catechol 2,3-dioxygenase-like lactoylglutathione lyase family enzyme